MVAMNGVKFDAGTPTISPQEIEESYFRALMSAHSTRLVGNDVRGQLAGNYSVQPFVDGRIGGSGLNGRGNSFGDSVGGMSDLDDQCGYEKTLSLQWFQDAYDRWGIAARVVNLWPDECWAIYPTVYETNTPGVLTPFEQAWNNITNNAVIFHYLHRIDRLSGIGQYGCLFLGLDDGGPLDRSPVGINKRTGKGKWRARKLNYVRALTQAICSVSRIDTDSSSPRYGQPYEYTIQFAGDAMDRSPGDKQFSVSGEVFGGDSGKKVETKVHWTRILHMADNRETSEIYGTPRLQDVANYLHDLRKVSGGSAEMFHRGGFPGYAFETYPDLAGGAGIDEASLKATIEAYQKGYQRYLATVGGKWNSLTPQVANPDPHLSWYIKLICATKGVPLRKFMGSEEGHLAGTSDSEDWKSRCSSRQIKYMEPMMLRPLVDRFIDLGILPIPAVKKQYFVEWKDLRALSDKDRVEVALKKVQMLMQYVTGFVEEIYPRKMLYTLIMGHTEDEANAIETEMQKNPAKPRDEIDPSLKPTPVAGPAGGGRTGAAFKAGAGKPKKSPPEGKPKSTKPGSGAKKVTKK